MKLLAAILLTLIQATTWPPYIRPDAEIEDRTVTVAYVHDGDTFRDEEGRNYRLAGIDAPEVAHPEHDKPDDEPGGPEAAEALRALLTGRTVTARIDRNNPLDRYGRTVAVILLGEQDVNLELIRSGHAVPRYLALSPMIDAEAFLAATAEQPAHTSGYDASAADSRVAEPEEPAPVSSHFLTAGDRIRVIIGPQTENFTLNPDGEIFIKGLGVFRAGGMTSPQAVKALDSAILARGITAPPATVFYLAPQSAAARSLRNITVLGAVRRPGSQTAATLVDAIREANPDTTADLRNVILDHAGETTRIDAAAAAKGAAYYPPLSEGDRILIPERPFPDTPQTVTVIGDVARPGPVQPGPLTQVLASAGGATNTARTTAIRVRLPDGTAQTYDLAKITQGRQDNPTLPANATVYVESDEPRRQGLADLRILIGIASALLLFATK